MYVLKRGIRQLKYMGFNKNDTVRLIITDIGTNGEGIGRVDGYTLFIKDAIIGDEVEAKIIKAKKNYGYARLMNIITPSKDRIEPVCPVARQCGGCQIQEMDYQAQLRFKQELVKNNIERIGHISDYQMMPVIGMDEPFHYRNKAQYPVGMDKDGNIVMGFFAGRTHHIIDNTDCALGAKINSRILGIIKEYMQDNKIKPYDEDKHAGTVRHILIRNGYHTDQIMVCLVINAESIKNSDDLVKRLKDIDGMTSIMININRNKTNVILGDTCKTLWGKSYIEDYICDIRYQISPLSFYQVNPKQTEKLYSKALEYAGLTGNETVWDLYCGIGTISLFMAAKARKVYGVEIVPQAIEDAKNNARLNNIDNAEFFVGKAEEIVPAFYEELSRKAANGDEEAKRGIHPDVVVVDPPRKGCEETLLETVVKMSPKRMVYVSCDSATLARDLKFMEEHGYKVEKVQAVDQFGNTVHVETVCLLGREIVSDKNVEYAHVDYEPKYAEYLKSAKGSASYREIKEWIKEQHDVSVSNLYIAQVKDKLSFEKRENYNKGADGHRVPNCPAEKEKLILEAFKHFRMI